MDTIITDVESHIYIGKWVYNHLTPAQVQTILKNYIISTKATAMVNGGAHQWWIEKEEIKCYGFGPGWQDQNSDCSFSLEEACEHISEISQTQKILIEVLMIDESDYDRLLGSSKYEAPVLYFDENDEQTWIQGQAKNMLYWKKDGCNTGYYP